MEPSHRASRPPLNLEDPGRGNISKLDSRALQQRLTESGISFDEKSKKSMKQAMLTIFQQGFIRSGDTPDPDIVEWVSDWIESPVYSIVAQLKEKNLDHSGLKWDHIEVLIAAECDSFPNQLAGLNLTNVPSSSNTSSPATVKPENPHPTIIKLLVDSILAHVKKSGNVSLPGCPVPSAVKIAQYLGEIPDFKTTVEVAAALKPPHTRSEKLLVRIFQEYGKSISIASDSFKIPGFLDGVFQFILHVPERTRHKQFLAERKKSSMKSVLLFHGTPFSNLHSILANGFKPAGDKRFKAGNFMAEEPGTSYAYAAKETYYLAVPSDEQNPSFSRCGVLFGCEVAGSGRPVRDGPGGVHVITNLPSIAIRYNFLVPQQHIHSYFSARDVRLQPPSRVAIRSAMVEAFKKFPDGRK